MRLFSFMFVTAVCVLFLMKIRWPKTKSIDLWFRHKLLLLLLLLLTFRPPFPGSFFCLNGIFIARHLSPLFVTGFVKLKKKPLTMVINMIRIAFTQSSSYSELLSKWLSSRSCLKFRGGNDDSNFLRHLVCLSFGRGPCSKMYARVTRDGAKNSTFGYFNGTNPATGKGIQLQSPTPIMAPG